MPNLSKWKVFSFVSFLIILLILGLTTYFVYQNPIQETKAQTPLPAFPGAEGFGSKTVGGRGGTILFVTNTNDSGPGSLRAALTASGSRIVIFKTGGTINLNTPIKIQNPYVTIAGQTAPGGGILIRGPYAPGSHDGGPTCLEINTHDIIIRGLRIREVNRATIGIYAHRNPVPLEIYNVIIDHCSFSWSTDTILDVFYDPHDITFSWNIISEGIDGGGRGLLIGGFDACEKPGDNFSVHHNLFAHNYGRNPTIKQKIGSPEVINNVVYNWGWKATLTYAEAAIIGNHYIAGNDTGRGELPIGVNGSGAECSSEPLQLGSVYVSHNIGPGRPTDTGDDWNIVSGSSTYRTNSPPFPLSGITVDDVSTIKSKVLAGAGAIVPTRDSVDVRIINDVKNGTGGQITDPADVGGWPSLATGTYPADTDDDGMPDSWETDHGLNPNNAADANGDQDGDGYTNIEEYINSLILTQPSVSPTPIPSPSIFPSPTPTPGVLPGLSWEAEEGEISSPFSVTNGYVSQSTDTSSDPSLGGKASYRFNLPFAGDYLIQAWVDALDDDTNSFFVNLDGEPTNPDMIWDIYPWPTNGFVERTVSWRGSGTYDNNEFVPKVFSLSPGEHELIIRGREANTKLDKLSLVPVISLSPGWNEIVWPGVAGKKASDTPGVCPMAVTKVNFWLIPYVKNYGGLNFEFESGKTYYIKCNQSITWSL